MNPDSARESSGTANSNSVPIAVVGLGCRFPGGVRDLASLGALLTSGTDAIGEVPPDRWGSEFHDRDAGAGTMVNRRGAFLEDVDRFDAAYFGISPREARHVDPQHRLLLEVASEAMADAGYPRAAWRGSRTAVFIGMLNNDYSLLHTKTLGTKGIGNHYAVGVEPSFAAGRLAYAFDLHGPTVTLHAACSSSLLAVHQACQSLRSGECDSALAGGVNLLLAPDISVFMSGIGAMSPSGRCRPFDRDADGFVRGEGCGVVVLKRLSDAVATGDRVYCVIRGSAVNNNGSSLGLTFPNARAQEALLHTALRQAALRADEVDYVEAHGTATQLGDMIELQTLREVYGAARRDSPPLHVGSHKAVFGHMDAAAGIAGLMKTAWIVGSGRAPGQPNLEVLNPTVDWRDGGITVTTSGVDLPIADRPVRAGVSAFGLSGTNVHMIVEAAAPTEASPADPAFTGPRILLASAFHGSGLAEQVSRYRTRVVEAEEDGSLDDLLASAAVRRTHEHHRYAAVADGPSELLTALGDPADPPDGAYVGTVRDLTSVPPVVFVYSGVGSQWPGMAADLGDADPTVRDTLDECDALIRAETSWSLMDELRRPADDSRLNRIDILQPAVFAVQVALSRWLGDRGVTPAAIVGHSLGEVAAAQVAGCLSLPEAVQLVVRRAAFIADTSGTGGMYAVDAGRDTVERTLAALESPVCVAAVNGPASVVVSGLTADLEEAVRALTTAGHRCKRVRVDLPLHSTAMAPGAARLRASIADLEPAEPAIRLLSTVDPEHETFPRDAAYWERNLTETVLLWPAVDRLLAEEDAALVEISPHPLLLPSLGEAMRRHDRQGPVLGVLRRDTSGPVAAHRALARLHVAGVAVDWAKVTGRPRRYRALPVPSWGGDRHWLPGVARGQQTTVGSADQRPTNPPPARIRLSLLDADGRVTAEMMAGPTDAASDGGVATGAPTGLATRGYALPAPAAQPAAAPPVRPNGLADHIEALVRDVLGLPDSQSIARRRGLFEQGLDSASAAALRARLESEFGVELPATIVFEQPTVVALAEYLADAGATSGTPGPAARPPVVVSGESGTDAVAVIGIACRFPRASSPDAFWSLLLDGRDAVSGPPAGRRSDPVWQEAGPSFPVNGCYLDDVSGFDAAFFRISPREAKSLDPQQRLFLEVCWEALEDAGCHADRLKDRPVGVYAALTDADYRQLLARDLDNVDVYYGTGTSFSTMAGRLSYFLGLTGPSLVVDTACSSSLTAVHLACQALRSGDCEVAVVGGASTITAPNPLLASMSIDGGLSSDGHSRAFDENGDGFGFGEGTAAVILKPLDAALRDGDRIYATIRGSALNQDGASGGLTVPNGASQTAVVRQALERAGWAPHEVDYVEAHGTGTPLGDPIEARALAAALGPGRAERQPLLIGSVKANIGHLGAAAGLAGLLKVVLSLRHRELPPHRVERPSSRIDWDRMPLALVRERQAWPENGRPRRAGVSAFGFSGTNAHILVEEFTPAGSATPDSAAAPHVLPLSAATPTALRTVARRLAALLRDRPNEVADVVYTATHRRAWLEHRLVVVGSDAAELASALEEVARGGRPPGVHVGSVPTGETRTVAFWFGTEPPAAEVRERLTATGSGYEQSLENCTREVYRHTGLTLDLSGDPPAGWEELFTFCHQVAATRAWAAAGIRPQAVIGQGSAVAARWAAGRLTLAEALRALVGASGETESADRPGDIPLYQASDGAGRIAEEVAAAGLQTVVDVLLGVHPLDGRFAITPGAGGERGDLADALAALFAVGCRPLAPESAVRRPIALPAYPWEHRSYWYRSPAVTDGPVAWLVSADSAAGLRGQVERLRSWLVGGVDVDVVGVARGLAGRAGLRHRLAVVGAGREELLTGLEAFSVGRPMAEVVRGSVGAGGGVVWVFPGQGWHWVGMGRELLGQSAVFAGVVGEVSGLVEREAGWSVVDVLGGVVGAPGWERVDVVQPVCFAVMVGLARLWESVGVSPAAVVGHSQGEIAAACVAGVLSLEDAVRVVVSRSTAVRRISGQGTAVSVTAPADQVAEWLKRWEGRLSVAAVNGPTATTVTGDPQAVDELLVHCREQRVRAWQLEAQYAGHGPQVDQIRQTLLDGLQHLSPTTGRTPLWSTVTGSRLADGRSLDADYWYANLRHPVLFDQAVRDLLDQGFSTFIEVSGHPVLTPAIEDRIQAAGADAHTVSTLLRKHGGSRRFHIAAARAWTHGVPVDWTRLHPSGPAVEPPAVPPAPEAGEDALTGRFWDAVTGEDVDEVAAVLDLAGDDQARMSLRTILPALSAWRRRQRQIAAEAAWRYELVWKPAVGNPPATLRGSWLVLTPAEAAPGTPVREAADLVLRALAEHGATPREIRCDPTELLPDLPVGRESSGIVSLLAMDERPHPRHPDVPVGLMATGQLVQDVHERCPEVPLWVATTGAVTTDPAAEPLTRPLQALVTGLLRAARLELRQPVAHLDLPSGPANPTLAARLIAALAHHADEAHIAVRAGGIFLARLARCPAPTPQVAGSAGWRPTGTTLITGGSGTVAAHTARWLARRGAPHLLLLSRSGADAPNADALSAELKLLGTQVTIAACDITDADELADALTLIPEDQPLTAVFHTACVIDDGLLSGMPPEQMERVLRPKVRGTLNLHHATQGTNLSAFVLFSSGANLLPSIGQSAYAASNAYLDAFAHHRRAAGLPATSIAWGAWGGGGGARTDNPSTWLNRNGIQAMSPETAITVMEQVLVRDETFVMVANVDWAQFVAASGADRPTRLVADIAEVVAGRGMVGNGATGPDAPESALLQRLQALPEERRETELLDLVCSHAAKVLGHPDTTGITPGRPFRDLGFDSVTGLEFRNHLVPLLGVRLPPTLVFDHPTPERLTTWLLTQLGAALADGGTDGADGTGEKSRLDDMGVEELLRIVRGQRS
ncbi:SDR family NAD(P)-dependent oxidoreductase [Solwaraspora sp. WMMD1047]|uniref:type I polyketide synthase n=1 Tax=Solwaraspora sp. WMMD1047 TaxID=3016102 RepID=UPI002415F35D|nr:type I polyketide synthase [Solwaraspora sp. WMMD1047]MDG4830623.1 SDR family NAD(P)-dependent oxidoreductase [Solwaraspora sp. WMMD1047]